MRKIDVLDKGYVRLVDVMGGDLSVVNSARVSYDKESFEIDEKDEKLIRFLAKHDHSSPFRHSILQFEMYAPLMVARQHWKYIVGSDHRDPFTAWNESSRRYITENAVFYVPSPTEWRSAPENSKQGSGKPVNKHLGLHLTEDLMKLIDMGTMMYERAMANGVCAEQARLFLPAYGLYVRYYWTGSLQSVAHFINQRLADDAQKEIQEYAKAVYELAKEDFPVSLDELVKTTKDAIAS
ncbi:FAD-dependent thymidylate synthase [Fredinandcohnia humi]